MLGYLCLADTIVDFETECQEKYPTNDWVVLHRQNRSETQQFIAAFNSNQNLRVRGFIIYGERFRARDL